MSNVSEPGRIDEFTDTANMLEQSVTAVLVSRTREQPHTVLEFYLLRLLNDTDRKNCIAKSEISLTPD
jgi:hypothetical protein